MSRTASVRSSRALPSPPSYTSQNSPHTSSPSPSPALPSPSIPPSLSHTRTYSQPVSSYPSRPHSTFDRSHSTLHLADDTPPPERPRLTVLPSPSQTLLTAGSNAADGVVMTWAGGSTTSFAPAAPDPDQPTVALSDAVLNAQAAEFSRYSQGWLHDDGDDQGSVTRLEDDPEALPPSYDDSRTLSTPTTFTFSTHAFNAMLLLPPADAADTRPVLHVSVAMNCFNPFSYVTTVRRGGTEQGEWIGEFEMGIAATSGTVTFGDKTKKIITVLRKSGSKQAATGTWTYVFSPQTPTLTWRWIGSTMNCYLTPRGSIQQTQIASFTGTPLANVLPSGQRVPAPTLKLWPAGYERKVLGHVVVSALIIERRRMCPATGDTKHLFT